MIWRADCKGSDMMAQRIPEEIQVAIPVGDLDLLVLAPAAREESGDRISFWWGLTTAAIALSRHLATLGDLRDERQYEDDS